MVAALAEAVSPAADLPQRGRPRLLARWLTLVALTVFAMVVIGGITRLTESGLSITEWKPITGAIPPLTEAQWQAEFHAYQQIGEYRQINGPAGMTLADYKFIYFWEWAHRLLGRVVGLLFALPLAFAWIRGWIPKGYKLRLVALLALGGLQGTFGWFMVRSGLSAQVTDVSHFWLSIHLMTALFTLAGLVWTALDLARLADIPDALAGAPLPAHSQCGCGAGGTAAARRMGRRAQCRAGVGYLAADAGAACARVQCRPRVLVGRLARSVPDPLPPPLVGMGRGCCAGAARPAGAALLATRFDRGSQRVRDTDPARDCHGDERGVAVARGGASGGRRHRRRGHDLERAHPRPAQVSALIWVPFADADQARTVARAVLDEKLVACANIISGVELLFLWEGRIDTASECGVLFKTNDALLAPAIARIEHLHPYQSPAIIGWHCNETGVATRAWLDRLTGGDGGGSDRAT